MIKSKTFAGIKDLYKSLPKKTKAKSKILFPLTLIASLVDILVLALLNRTFNFFLRIPNSPINFLKINDINSEYKLIITVLLLISSVWLASLIKMLLKSRQFQLRNIVWRDLSETAYKNVLNQEYEYFSNKSTVEISSSVLITFQRVADLIVLPTIQILSGVISIVFVSTGIIALAKTKALLMISIILSGYFIFSIVVTPIMREALKKRRTIEIKTNRILTDSIKSLIDVNLTNSENFFTSRYTELGRASIPFISKAQTLKEIPRAFIEPLGITVIFIVGLYPYLISLNFDGVSNILPFLAIVAAGSLKLTPSLQDTFRSFNSIKASLPYLEEALILINLKRKNKQSQNKSNKKSLNLKEFISLNNNSYKYPNATKNAISEINIRVEAGKKIAFIGKNGSGKSTAARLLLGLLSPQKGDLIVDGIKINYQNISNWQNLCSYVPQNFYLNNTSIAENVAFGIKSENIDREKVWAALKIVKLEKFVKEKPHGLDTTIYEDGINFSGGQRQRIAIARAIFKESKFLILDEATSAIDNKTQSEILFSIDKLLKNCTIVIIAHRLSTIKNCDEIYVFKEGNIVSRGDYNTLMKKSKSFRELRESED